MRTLTTILTVLLFSTSLISQENNEYRTTGIVEIKGTYNEVLNKYNEEYYADTTFIAFMTLENVKKKVMFCRLYINTSEGEVTHDSKIILKKSKSKLQNYITYKMIDSFDNNMELSYNGDDFILYYNLKLINNKLEYINYYQGSLIKN